MGRRNEKKHFEDLARREETHKTFLVQNWSKIPEGHVVSRADLVFGTVVISEDVWKRFLARLKGLVGGNIKSYESLMDRARREACLRMLEDAKVRFDFVDIEDTTSPRMSQLLALSNDKELPQLFVEGVAYIGKQEIRRYIGA